MRAFLRDNYLKLMGSIKKPQPGIHIINSHYVTPSVVDYKRDAEIFERYLRFLRSIGDFITLEEATRRIFAKDFPNDKVLISFTFDDGFEECYGIIAPLLEKFNTKGTFFINANYIDSYDRYQEQFHQRVNTYTKNPMTWEQVENLHERGHLIGSHNFDHVDFSELSSNDVEFQLRENKKILEQKLDYQCEYFAWTYGQLRHFPENALKITKKYHKYIFSGTNYKFYSSLDGEVINRRHIESFFPKSYIRYFLSHKKKIK
ncbi:polysaccharide deacetylase family protein [Proteiniphilum sp.]|uniref:polysaccharide deacetylase family protein n=1 Tax=Proteiniphilum sp. TaxID=1926877 RepID=UPI0033233E9B